MSDTLRYRRGDTKPVFAAPASATVIEIGDLLYLDSSTKAPKPAGLQADEGNLLANQMEFHDNFLGVAEQASASGETDDIRIATAGDFEFPCASATFDLGDLIGAVEASSGTALEDQKVVEVAGEYAAIGRCCEKKAVAGTSMMVRIRSTVMEGLAAGVSS
jgi:hypothetical protein